VSTIQNNIISYIYNQTIIKLSPDERVFFSQEHRPSDLNDVQNIELERHSIHQPINTYSIVLTY